MVILLLFSYVHAQTTVYVGTSGLETVIPTNFSTQYYQFYTNCDDKKESGLVKNNKLTLEAETTYRFERCDIGHPFSIRKCDIGSNLMSNVIDYKPSINDVGNVEYYCTLHPDLMKGNITIVSASNATPNATSQTDAT